MCLPGTIETVRAEIEAERDSGPGPKVTRRATLVGAGGAALGAFLPVRGSKTLPTCATSRPAALRSSWE
jgi:hypothetical protein